MYLYSISWHWQNHTFKSNNFFTFSKLLRFTETVFYSNRENSTSREVENNLLVSTTYLNKNLKRTFMDEGNFHIIQESKGFIRVFKSSFDEYRVALEHTLKTLPRCTASSTLPMIHKNSLQPQKYIIFIWIQGNPSNPN